MHTRDIARAAAELTTSAAPGRHVRYVASDERTANEVAHVLSAAIGRASLLRHGLPATQTDEVVDICASIGNGILGEDYNQHKPPLGQEKLEDFAQEFAAAFAAAG
ncbi:hypothetical protein JAO73_13190 [Hymenobacter sp. BT523]|uniref:hypothetical protein n=1 Tax=Hymenobacter sp. BT523 TaxID=2795725 RepID=UPI0018EB898D|nr:hypothetical protein [Hymenobacter sp. BT523]MBJ6109971.1 hypothetical protein [Hymenobacter sp. BT523]